MILKPITASLCASLALFATASVAAGEPPSALPRKDIYVQDLPDRLVLGNPKLKLEIGKAHGEWLSMSAEGISGNLIARDEKSSTVSPGVDFRIDDIWMVERFGATWLRYEPARSGEGEGACIVLGVGPWSRPPLIPERWRARAPQAQLSQARYEYELHVCYTLFPGESRMERTARVVRVGGADILASTYVRMQGFLFQLPNASVADPADCTVENPGPLFPGNFIPPGTPYHTVSGRYYSLNSAPDLTFGLLAIVNHKLGATLATWMETRGEAGYLSYLSGDGERVTPLHYNLRIDRMAKGGEVASDAERIELTSGGLPSALARYREMTSRTMPIAAETPDWAREMIVLEVYPAYFADGINGLTKRLEFYRQIGFNTIYLMPHYLGGYSPIDQFTVDPKIGTPDDLKTMVQTAHALGMHVLFDMVIHGFNKASPVVWMHPEFFQKDETGRIVFHQTWGSMATDAASPAYQKCMADLAVHDIQTYGIDGYRVDANAYRMPNWDPAFPLAPGVSSSATLPLLKHVYAAMRSVKPDTVLLSEIFGPVWHSVSNAVHENMTMGPMIALEMMDKGEYTAAQYKEQLADVLDMLPEGATRVRFARNHDTSWFYHFNGYTPRFLALDAIHALFGVPEVFAGDPNNPPDPETVYDYYRKLFALRREFPEFASGEVLLRAVDCDNPWVFTGLRRLNGQTSLVAISLSAKEEDAALSIAGPVRMIDPIQGGIVEPAAGPIKLHLRPFQVLVGRLP